VFTGIVQEIGQLLRRDSRAGSAGSDLRVAISCGPALRERLTLGASVAVDGVCLTVAALEPAAFEADVSGSP
jgi:riboflavin synthase